MVMHQMTSTRSIICTWSTDLLRWHKKSVIQLLRPWYRHSLELQYAPRLRKSEGEACSDAAGYDNVRTTIRWRDCYKSFSTQTSTIFCCLARWACQCFERAVSTVFPRLKSERCFFKRFYVPHLLLLSGVADNLIFNLPGCAWESALAGENDLRLSQCAPVWPLTSIISSRQLPINMLPQQTLWFHPILCSIWYVFKGTSCLT